MKKWLINHWAFLTIGILLSIMIIAHFQPGKYIVGNDNFSPELNPLLTVTRSIQNPAWRTYRALGIPSDSEQADLWRSFLYLVLVQVFPGWFISQIYLYSCLAIGVVSMGKLAQYFTKKTQSAFFLGSLAYLTTLNTAWVFFYPVHLFVATYAFLPLVLLSIIRYLNKPSFWRGLCILIASCFFSTASLTATMFITSTLTLIPLVIIYCWQSKPKPLLLIKSVLLFIIPHLFWILSFVTYVQTNALALQSSSINREITTTTIQSEMKYNTALNTLRYKFSWLDIQEDSKTHTFPFYDWINNEPISWLLYIPPVIGLLGCVVLVLKKRYKLLSLCILFFGGWFVINGTNPPAGFLFDRLQNSIPLFKQVFRWQSSKLWPLMTMTLPLLITATTYLNNRIARRSIIIIFAGFQCTIFYFFFIGKLVRPDVYVSIPPEYQSLSKYLTSNHPNDRLLVLPEANTRYFRSYKWGFWGSTILNYILPNPLIEKALVIGSTESEQAFNAIIEALNSQEKNRFNNILEYYQTPLILLDKSADDSRLGRTFSYPYNWSLYQNMIDNNQNLNKIWEQDSLTLYEIKTTRVRPYTPKFNSNPLVDTTPWYYSSSAEISILSILPHSISTTPDDLIITSSLNNPILQRYSYQLSPEQLNNLPSIWSFDGTTLSISPAAPNIETSDVISAPDDISYSSFQGNAFLTVGNNIISPVQSTTLNIPVNQLPQQIGLWANAPKVIDLLPNPPKSATQCENSQQRIETSQSNNTIYFSSSTKDSSCFALNHTFIKPSIVTFEAEVSTNTSTIPASLCLHSEKLNRCVNDFRGFYASPTPQTISVTLPIALDEKDDLVAFFSFSPTEITNEITITSPRYTYFDTHRDIDLPKIDYSNSAKSIEFPPYSEIHITYPTITEEQTGINLKHKYGLLPTIFHGMCESRAQEEFVKSHFNNAISFQSSNCFDGVYAELVPVDAQAYILAANSTNDQGIPLEISIRHKSEDKKLYSDFISSTQPLFKILPTSPSTESYFTEIMSRGIGPQPSQNTLTDFTVFPIPQAWADLKLTPITPQPARPITILTTLNNQDNAIYVSPTTEANMLYALPTATSPNWKAVITPTKPKNALHAYLLALTTKHQPQSTTINGWQQAYLLPENTNDNYLVVIFVPNALSYAGLIAGWLLGLWLISQTKSGTRAPSPK